MPRAARLTMATVQSFFIGKALLCAPGRGPEAPALWARARNAAEIYPLGCRPVGQAPAIFAEITQTAPAACREFAEPRGMEKGAADGRKKVRADGNCLKSARRAA